MWGEYRVPGYRVAARQASVEEKRNSNGISKGENVKNQESNDKNA